MDCVLAMFSRRFVPLVCLGVLVLSACQPTAGSSKVDVRALALQSKDERSVDKDAASFAQPAPLKGPTSLSRLRPLNRGVSSGSLVTLPSAGALQGASSAPPVSGRVLHPKAESRLQDLVEIQEEHGTTAARALAAKIGADLNEDGLFVQLDLSPGVLADDLPEALFTQHGAHAVIRGLDVLNVRVPLDRLLPLLDASPSIAWARLPQRPVPMMGAKLSEGVLASWATGWHCTGKEGAGVDVAVLDSGFKGIFQSKGAGEIPKDVEIHPGPTDTTSAHGTACLEVVADMVPGATLHAVPSFSMAMMQDFAYKKLKDSSINVISHSMGWFGMGFGRNDGKLCRLVEHIRSLGVSFVVSAGNEGHMRIWRGTFNDSKGTGWHTFKDGTIYNRVLVFPGKKVRLLLDWDEYPKASTDFDLYLCRVVGGKCETVLKSTNPQTGKQPPYEAVMGTIGKAGLYGVAIHRKAGTGQPMMRLHLLDGAGLVDFTVEGSVSSPASCTAALAVGALPWEDYQTGPLADYSSHGPTEDGRTKPEIAAPTSVSTAIIGSFSGTSAACPHAAAAVALYMSATPISALEAAQQMLDDAVPMGKGHPNNAYGYGRLRLNPALSGAACHPGERAPCQTTCGSTGQQGCAPGCETSTCEPPPEVCNGKDDNCDGKTDENQICAPGQTSPCKTECDTPGTTTCQSYCAWGTCEPDPVKELCDGVDNDCDDETDEDFECKPGGWDVCQTACGTVGERRCTSKCSWEACKPPKEECNLKDDDCDGQTDEDFDCVPGTEGSCQTTCGSQGHHICLASCGWGECEPPEEVCNDRDDDCDGQVDQGISCGGCGASPAQPQGAAPLGFLLFVSLALIVLTWRRRV